MLLKMLYTACELKGRPSTHIAEYGLYTPEQITGYNANNYAWCYMTIITTGDPESAPYRRLHALRNIAGIAYESPSKKSIHTQLAAIAGETTTAPQAINILKQLHQRKLAKFTIPDAELGYEAFKQPVTITDLNQTLLKKLTKETESFIEKRDNPTPKMPAATRPVITHGNEVGKHANSKYLLKDSFRLMWFGYTNSMKLDDGTVVDRSIMGFSYWFGKLVPKPLKVVLRWANKNRDALIIGTIVTVVGGIIVVWLGN